MGSDDKRRNSKPGEVTVKTFGDIANIKSLNEKVEIIVENRNEVVIHNIELILQRESISQAHMCNVDLEGLPQPPQLAAYKKAGKDIPFRTITRIGLAYGYTPEQMCGQLLDQPDGRVISPNTNAARPLKEYDKYIGTYHMAYFGTDAKLGGNKRTTARALSFGMLSVYQSEVVNGVPVLHVVAFTNCTDEERDKIVRTTKNAEFLGGGRSVRACYENIASAQTGNREMPRMKCFYEGELYLSERVAEITLRQVSGSDVVHIELHNRAANSSEGSQYKGGLATMMSTSRGEEHMPCIQAAIISKRGFSGIAKEELAELLFLEPPQVNVHEETKAIITYMKALFPGEDADNPLAQLGEAEKAFVLESYIERKLTDVIKRNVLGYYKVSTAMDSDIYKAVCR